MTGAVDAAGELLQAGERRSGRAISRGTVWIRPASGSVHAPREFDDRRRAPAGCRRRARAYSRRRRPSACRNRRCCRPSARRSGAGGDNRARCRCRARARISTSAASSASAISGLVVSLRTNQSKEWFSPSARTPECHRLEGGEDPLRVLVVGRHEDRGAALERRDGGRALAPGRDDDRASKRIGEGQRDPADIKGEEHHDERTRSA